MDGNVFTLPDVGIETREILCRHLSVFTLLDVDGNVFTLLDVGKETREIICKYLKTRYRTKLESSAYLKVFQVILPNFLLV